MEGVRSRFVAEIRDRLRRPGALDPHDDTTALADLKARGLSNCEIAVQACTGVISKPVHTRVERFGLSESDSAALLESMNPEELGLPSLESQPDRCSIGGEERMTGEATDADVREAIRVLETDQDSDDDRRSITQLLPL